MGRKRSFDESTVLDTAARTFVAGGYEGTSVDDLVSALDLHRGSLYKAFGSKRGVFVAALRQYVEVELTAAVTPIALVGTGRLDLLLVAALERGHRDPEIADLVQQGLANVESALSGARVRRHPRQAIGLLGERLYERLGGTRAKTATEEAS